ncbi:polysaccharide biosynthesis/export family protein [Rhodoferax sp.]|uniref:polysaccharide biosynthesis/export family protein n=1 Tax=Rhodoferax sp. TaxID=50421 RepID=UPI002607110C|nr:polysaccharide biosynthesis/export family protein [Rhodoferax sp.]
MYFLRHFLWFPLAFILAVVSSVWASEALPSPTEPVYRVSINDELSFRFFYLPELNTVVTVRADGRVSLPLVGELEVDGLTMSGLTERVERLMAVHVRRPQVIVNVQSGSAQRVFVGGEVIRPGVQPLRGPLTALQAVTVAEGLKDSAQPRDVIVLRRGEAGARVVLRVDLAAAMNGTDLSQDVLLQAYDVVVVPRSGIADLGLWVDQYIKRVLPFSLGFSYTINKNGAIQ